MTTSRREFFKTAAMGAVGAGAAFGTVAAEAKAAAPSKYDIIILGAGCGGLTCAVRAAENGLKPLLLEKRLFRHICGLTPLPTGGLGAVSEPSSRRA